MPISNKYKLIFIHIPKTGGTSIESFFDMTENDSFCFYRWDRDQQAFIENNKHLCNSPKINYEPQHYPLDVLKDLIKDYDNYYKFSFTRNPYTKLLSEYFWINNKQINSVADFNPIEFHEWCVNYLSVLDNSHKEPQVNYIDESVDFVGKYENLAIDFEVLKTKLIHFSEGFSTFKSKELARMNSTGMDKEVLIDYLLPETKQLIFSTYKSDFIAFSYDSAL